LGTGAAERGLAGDVDADQLRTALMGRRVPGFDLTFSAPKSVSLLFALGQPEVSAVVRDAHDAAVSAALTWLDGEACWVRRGAGGVQQLPGGGFVAAAFRHRTSRAGD